MTNSESHHAAATAKGPRRFFDKQLAGEQPLTFETACQLYQLSVETLELEPWQFLDDQDLILVPDIESGEICYCSIMGALGEVFSFHVYVGAESYRFFRKIASGKPISAGDFYASMRGVSVEFVNTRDQTPPDRELLQAFGHPNKRGKKAPIFRAYRPGYHPWYLTEGEGKLLVFCLRTALAFCLHAEEMDDVDYWADEGVFPFLTPDPEDKTRNTFEIRPATAPEPPNAAAQPAELDENLLSEIVDGNLPRRGTLETDHFFASAEIGEKNERKACLRTAFVAEAASGFAYMAELGKPEDSTGKLLLRALLGAMREGKFIPKEVLVRQKEFNVLLSALSDRLGIEVRVTKSLPALDALKNHFFATIGEPPDFTDS